MPHLAFVKSADKLADEIERNRAAQRVEPPAASAEPPVPGAERPAPTAVLPPPSLERPAPSPLAWSGFRGPDRDGVYRETPDRHHMARGRSDADVEAADRRRATRRSRSARGRAFTIEQRRRRRSRRGLRHRDGPRAVDEQLDAPIPRADGRRRSARDADVGRRPRLRARRAPASCACLDDATGRVIWRPTSSRTTAPTTSMGHVRVPAHRRRHRHRASRRPQRQIGRRLRPPHRQARVVRAGRSRRVRRRRCSSRSAGVRADSRRERGRATDGALARPRRAALGIPVDHAVRHQRGAAGRDRRQSRVHLVGLRDRRGRHRAVAAADGAFARAARSGATCG